MPLKQFLIAFDQLINTLVWDTVFGWGHADETLSARAWRLSARHPDTWGRFENAINAVFFWDKDTHGRRAHCYLSYLAELQRRHLPEEYLSA